MNSADVRIEVLTVSDRLIENDDIEQFLSEHGYSLNNISWMATPVDFVPVKFHEYGICAADGEKILIILKNSHKVTHKSPKFIRIDYFCNKV